MKLSRRKFLRVAANAGALPLVSQIARAQPYPTRPVRLIEGIGAGATTDLIARLMGKWLSERLGTPFVIENRSGANGNIAAELVRGRLRTVTRSYSSTRRTLSTRPFTLSSTLTSSVISRQPQGSRASLSSWRSILRFQSKPCRNSLNLPGPIPAR